ncbi:MAG: redoxin domain-containing protein [Candidatus Dadabacteria bacterium]|nr:redoxin domain-containing protein [Candidatus Dadabacteria bacterium]NIS08952.1 redoxin domain-containing protein [Candidatus Dadabacteria bacterium]NIV41667.1 redoxin domain-containing protein [Candidatus Dadabacteria bacterium]NIY21391.1 redoxin domain-containing protein [Candidatus Dadabacteria bacterium]
MIRNKILILILILIPTLSHGLEYVPKDGVDIIGTKAPAFFGLTWLNTEPLTIEALKGKVVLIRFWLVGCPYCTNSAPTLVEFHKKYYEQGLVIIGVHHPKSEETRNNGLVKKRAEVFGFGFPIAQDLEWKTINAYWLGKKKRSFTSSSILIDKKGIIHFVHDGGAYFRSDYDRQANAAFEAMEENI